MDSNLKKIIAENTQHIKSRKERKNYEEWIRAYYLISKETGIKLEDAVNYSYCLVKKGNLFGKIGVYVRREFPIEYFRFGRKIIGFDSRKNGNNNEYFWARNVIMILEEREKLFKLF